MDGRGNAVAVVVTDEPLSHVAFLPHKDARNFKKLIAAELSDSVEISEKEGDVPGTTKITFIIRSRSAIEKFKKSIVSGPLKPWKVLIKYPPAKTK